MVGLGLLMFYCVWFLVWFGRFWWVGLFGFGVLIGWVWIDWWVWFAFLIDLSCGLGVGFGFVF